MATDHIRYDVLARDALRGVLRRVLTDAAEHGLPGEHHFFITFLSTAEGVKLSPRLLAQYPEEMTVILQHQFWDLTVTGGSFRGRPVVRRHPRAAGGAVQFDQELLRPVGAIRPAVRAVRCRSRKPAPANLPAVPARPSGAADGRRNRPPKARPSRPSRAKAPKSCGWIVSARNNPRARNPRAAVGMCNVRPRSRAQRILIDGSIDTTIATPLPRAPRPTASVRSRFPPIAIGARRPNVRRRNFRIGHDRMPMPIIHALGDGQAGLGRNQSRTRTARPAPRRRHHPRRARGDRRQARRSFSAGGLADRIRHANQHEPQRGDRQPRQRTARRQARRQAAGSSQRSRQHEPVVEQFVSDRDAHRGRDRASPPISFPRSTNFIARCAKRKRRSPASSRSAAPTPRTRRR